MSGIGGVNTAQQVNNLASGQEAQGAQKAEGKHQQFQAVSVTGLDTSALEEVSIFKSTTRKSEKKDDKEKSLSKELEKQLERIRETIPDMPDAEQANLLLSQLQQAEEDGELTDDQIKGFTSGYSGDQSHQYEVLEAIVEQLRSQGNDKLADRLKNYNDEFYRENKKDIQSGINVSAEAAKFAEANDVGSVQELRDGWRNVLDLPGFETPLEAYNFVKEKFGYDDVVAGVEWAIQAYGAELSAMTPSVDASHLTFVRKNLQTCYGLNTTIHTCQENEAKFERMMKQNA